jgi:hypothetical protein
MSGTAEFRFTAVLADPLPHGQGVGLNLNGLDRSYLAWHSQSPSANSQFRDRGWSMAGSNRRRLACQAKSSVSPRVGQCRRKLNAVDVDCCMSPQFAGLAVLTAVRSADQVESTPGDAGFSPERGAHPKNILVRCLVEPVVLSVLRGVIGDLDIYPPRLARNATRSSSPVTNDAHWCG